MDSYGKKDFTLFFLLFISTSEKGRDLNKFLDITT